MAAQHSHDDGKINWMLGSAVILFALPLHLFLPLEMSVQLAALLLSSIAGVYFGFAIVSGDQNKMMIELTGAGLYGLVALAGLVWWQWLIPIGLAAHAIWDLAHHNRFAIHKSLAPTPQWYVPTCVYVDVVLAVAFSAIWFLKG